MHRSHMLLSSARLFTSIITVPDVRGERVPSSSRAEDELPVSSQTYYQVAELLP